MRFWIDSTLLRRAPERLALLPLVRVLVESEVPERVAALGGELFSSISQLVGSKIIVEHLVKGWKSNQ